MSIKLKRRKSKHILLSVIYRLAKILPISSINKLKIALDLEWIFDRISHEYSFKHYANANHPIRTNTIRFLKKHLQPDHSVLDIGCHAGDLTSLISGMVEKTIGIDYNEHWIKIAKEHFSNIKNLEFYHGDAHDYLLRFPSDYDVLILSHILEHLDEPQLFINRFKTFFRFVYIELPDFEKSYLNQYRQDLNLSLLYTDADHVTEFDRDDLVLLLKECGLNIVSSEYRHGVQRLWCGVNSK